MVTMVTMVTMAMMVTMVTIALQHKKGKKRGLLPIITILGNNLGNNPSHLTQLTSRELCARPFPLA